MTTLPRNVVFVDVEFDCHKINAGWIMRQHVPAHTGDWFQLENLGINKQQESAEHAGSFGAAGGC